MIVEDWMDLSLCRRFPALPWIAEPGGCKPAVTSAMGAVCLACTVRLECESFVGREGIISGFWAGQDRTPESEESSQGGAA